MASIGLISLNYSPEPIGIGPYSEGLARHFVAQGHQVTVIAGVPYYPAWELAAGFQNDFADTIEHGVRVIRVPHHIPAHPTVAARLVHYATFAANCARAINRLEYEFEPDAVIAIAPALLAAPVALRWARRASALSWLHIQDFEVGAALATGLLPGSLGFAGEQFERAILKRFDWVSSISPRMVEAAIAKGAPAPNTCEMRNWAEPEIGLPTVDPAQIRRELGLPDGVLALYSGNLARKQGIGLILEAAHMLRERGGLQFVICGDGPFTPQVIEASRSLPNLCWRPLQDRARLPELLAMADIHLLPQIAGAADLVLPSKLANMLASGRPVIATADHGTSLAHEVEGCGMIVPAGNAAEFAAAVETMAADAPMRKRAGKGARQRAHERWSRQQLLDGFVDAVEIAIRRHAA